MKRKILFFVTSNFPYGNGETFIENEIDYLGNKFDTIYIFTKKLKKKVTRKIPENFYCIDLNKNFFKLAYLFSCLFFKDFIKSFVKVKSLKDIRMVFAQYLYSIELNYKIIETIKNKNLENEEIYFYSYWFLYGAYIGSKLRSNKLIKRIISRAHGCDLYDHRGYQVFDKKAIIKNLDYLIPCSKEGEKYLKDRYLEENVFCSYLGTLNENRINVDNISNKKIIVSCSNVIPLKRIELIIEALSEYSKINKNFEWIHFGDGIEMENIQELAKIKLKNINYKFEGRVSNKKVLEFYKTNNPYLFLNVSSSEGLPVSIMEAQSYGIPVIATDVGGVSEIINNKVGVLLSQNPKISEIAEAISKIMKLSKKEYIEFRKSSYNNWKENFNAENNYNNFIKKYLLGDNNE